MLRKPLDLSQIHKGTRVYVYRDGPGGKLGLYEGPYTYIGDDGSRRAMILSGGAKLMLVHSSRLIPTKIVHSITHLPNHIIQSSTDFLEPPNVSPELQLSTSDNAKTMEQSNQTDLEKPSSSPSCQEANTEIAQCNRISPWKNAPNSDREPLVEETTVPEPPEESASRSKAQEEYAALDYPEFQENATASEQKESSIQQYDNFSSAGQQELSSESTDESATDSAFDEDGTTGVSCPFNETTLGEHATIEDVDANVMVEKYAKKVSEDSTPGESDPVDDHFESYQTPTAAKQSTKRIEPEPETTQEPRFSYTRSGRKIQKLDYAEFGGKRKVQSIQTIGPDADRFKRIKSSVLTQQQLSMYNYFSLDVPLENPQDPVTFSRQLPTMPSSFAYLQSIPNLIDKENTRTTSVPYSEAIKDEEFWRAMQDEIESFYKNGSVEEVLKSNLMPGTPILSTKWVLTLKNIAEELSGVQYKARLTVRGYEDCLKNVISSYAPTLSKSTLRLILAFTAFKKWNIRSVDFSNAFLQGSSMRRDLYIQPPKEFVSSTVAWRVVKSVYGLVSAPAAWYRKLHSVLLNSGFQQSKYDPCLYYVKDKEGIHGVLGTHVDDAIFSGDSRFDICMAKVKSALKTKPEQRGIFDYCALKIHQYPNFDIRVNQNDYATSIQPLDLPEDNKTVNPTIYRGVVGKLLYLSSLTRPDLSFDVSAAARQNTNPSTNDVVFVNRIVGKVHRMRSELMFKANVRDLKIVCFSDASWANLKQGCSQGGFIIGLSDPRENHIVGWIDYKSHKLRRVARSSATAETIALTEAVDHAIWLKLILEEIYQRLDPISVFTDCNDLLEIAKSQNITEEKRLMLNITSLREDLRSRNITMSWIPAAYNIADVLTKANARTHNMDIAIQKNRLAAEQYGDKLKRVKAADLDHFFSRISVENINMELLVYWNSEQHALLDSYRKPEGRKEKD
jgi:hypothetical protein